MAGRIVPVDKTNQSQLYEYSASYAIEHDSSYLPGRDFDLSEEHPSFLLVDEGEVVGAVSLMKTKRFLSIGKGRFSIFHVKNGDPLAYARLFKEILPFTKDLNSVFMFIPEHKEDTAAILDGLGFQIERFSFILERDVPAFADPVFPEGVSIRQLGPSDKQGISKFADCINEEFKHLAGHTPATAEDIQSWFEDKEYIAGGLCLLENGGRAIGTIAMMKDLDTMDSGEIGALGILEEHRGLGLGRLLIRYGFNFLADQRLTPVALSVNGENRGAIRLYESEGFKLNSAVVCYSLERE